MIVYSVGVRITSSNTGATAFEITSTEEEKKTVSVLEYDNVLTDEVILTVWLEREKIVDAVPLEIIASLMPVRKIEMNVEIPVGETLIGKLTPKSSGSQGELVGLVYYTIEK